MLWHQYSRILQLWVTSVSVYICFSLRHITNSFIFVLFLLQQPPPHPQWVMASSFTRFLDHTQPRNTVSRTPLDERSARRTDLYLTTHNRQTSMPPAVFEPTISADELSQTLDRAATGTGNKKCKRDKF